jgi:proteic killer suppression protein
VIKNFRHKGLRRFFEEGSKAGIQPEHANRLMNQLALLTEATAPEDMNLPGWSLHALKGDLNGYWAVTVNGNWRLIFRFDGKDVFDVDYLDYH